MHFRWTSSAPRKLSIGAALLLAAVSSLMAQNASGPQDGTVVFRETVRRVVVDVVVTDASGKPVRDLDQKDFSLAEDGKPQRILSFEPHTLELAPAHSSFNLPSLPANTYLNVPAAPDQGPLYILLLDLVNTYFDDQATGRAQLLKFINSKPPGTRFAVFVVSDDLHLVQGFTSDPQTLYAALDPNHASSRIPKMFLYGEHYGAANSGVTLEVLHRIANFVDELPGRKNLIWISGFFPLKFSPGVGEDPALLPKIKAMLDAMAANQISIYPIDVRGLVVGSAGMNPAATGLMLAAEFDSMDQIAKLTGGHAFYSNNGIADLLHSATEQGATYYTLSYSPANRKYDGKLRQIAVSLSRKGYNLAYRRSYYASDTQSSPQIAYKTKPDSPAAPATRPVGDSLFAEMQHGAPMVHELLFKAHLQALGPFALGTPEQIANLAEEPAYFRGRQKKTKSKAGSAVELQPMMIDLTLPAAQLRSRAGDEFAPALELAAAAYDTDGRMLNGAVEPALEPVSSDPGGDGHLAPHTVYRIQEQIDVPRGSASIRIAVRDIRTDRLGTIEVPLPLAPERALEASAR